MRINWKKINNDGREIMELRGVFERVGVGEREFILFKDNCKKGWESLTVLKVILIFLREKLF